MSGRSRPQVWITEVGKFPRESWEKLEAVVGPVEEGTLDALFARGAETSVELLCVGLQPTLTEAVLARFPKLKAIVTATGDLGHIDLHEAARRGVRVVSLQGEAEFLSTVTSTAEFTWGLLLAALRKIPKNTREVLDGHWRREHEAFGFELNGKTLGLLGFGRLGKWMARYGQAFGMQVLAHDPHVGIEEARACGVDGVDREALFRHSQVVSLHLPLSEETRLSIGAREFSWMPVSSVFINTSCAAIVDDAALLDALRTGKLITAAQDVLSGEAEFKAQHAPLEHPLLEYARKEGNLLITSHIAGQARDAIEKTRRYVVEKALRGWN